MLPLRVTRTSLARSFPFVPNPALYTASPPRPTVAKSALPSSALALATSCGPNANEPSFVAIDGRFTSRSRVPFATCVTAPVRPTQVLPNGPGWQGPEPPAPASATKYERPVTRKIPRGSFSPEATVVTLASPLAAAGGRSATDNAPATTSINSWNLVRRARTANTPPHGRSHRDSYSSPTCRSSAILAPGNRFVREVAPRGDHPCIACRDTRERVATSVPEMPSRIRAGTARYLYSTRLSSTDLVRSVSRVRRRQLRDDRIRSERRIPEVGTGIPRASS